jgi:hypothetical protein
MLEFMLIMVILDALVKLPDVITVRKLRKAGWKGGLNDYYRWKRR